MQKIVADNKITTYNLFACIRGGKDQSGLTYLLIWNPLPPNIPQMDINSIADN